MQQRQADAVGEDSGRDQGVPVMFGDEFGYHRTICIVSVDGGPIIASDTQLERAHGS